MPTVEQLYTLIGAKDGFIFDLQLQLSGLVQEHNQVKAERDELQEKLDKFNTPANVKPDAIEWIDAQPQLSMTNEPVETDEFKATFKP